MVDRLAREQPMLAAAVAAKACTGQVVAAAPLALARGRGPTYFLNSHRSRVRIRLTTMEVVTGK